MATYGLHFELVLGREKTRNGQERSGSFGEASAGDEQALDLLLWVDDRLVGHGDDQLFDELLVILIHGVREKAIFAEVKTCLDLVERVYVLLL